MIVHVHLYISICELCTKCVEFFGLTFEFWPQGLNSQNSEWLKQFDEMRDDFGKFFVPPKSTFYRHYIIDSQQGTWPTSFWQVKVITELWEDQMISDCPGNRRILSAEYPIQISLWFTIWELKSPYESPNLPNIIEWCRSCKYVYIYIYTYMCVCVRAFKEGWTSANHWISPNLKLEHLSLDRQKGHRRGRACNTSVIGLLRGWCPRGATREP